ncbi:hypothetical protein NDQ41_00705 [Alcaligenes faecalis]|jgi:hypothetical protein|uniref:Uncharacterized protein n=1 Tax=Alcaligenes phenolicus TaxID=232846 RepID=A0AAW5VNX3_9BURK|nr:MULTISPECIES: hypothetical protein [Alcaligenes]MCM2557222.1 hypothetical protein [Alcaligenes faecalis]MCM2620636.1 hypothetical protein [Alcaligenes faecalis]MCR4143164.1 hypothetical protein [Alcaligenes faecalis]MCX5564551.1 hypothetical protein [Alcaligenes phenolicus]MDK7585049.1 hypothetical protein [Alcaligenes phenolicus]
MHVFYLSKQDIDNLLPLVQAALHADRTGQVGFTDEELALRAALEAMQDPKLSELLAGARVEPGRIAVGLAEEDYRENLLALETRDSAYVIDQLMDSYAGLPEFFDCLEF